VSSAVLAWVARGALAAAATLVIACGAGAPRPSSAPASGPAATATPSSIAAGRRLFASEHCGDCHALAAVGARGGSGPDFDTSERLSQAQLRVALAEGANGMPSYAGRLAPRQLDALAAFLFAATHR